MMYRNFLLTGLFLIGFPVLLSSQSPSDTLAHLHGLWGAHQDRGPEIAGLLSLRRVDDTWRAHIGGYTMQVEVTEGILNFEVPGHRGHFRGRWDQTEHRIDGHWIQPATQFDGVSYATPISLKQTQPALWQGAVKPRPDQLTFYLMIRKNQDGSTIAFLRNPERNIGIFFGMMRVERDAEHIRFLNDEGETALEGIYRAEADQISLYFPFYNLTFDFTRRGRDQATGFFARSSAESQYQYHQPPALTDGWATSTPMQAGLDPEPLHTLVQQILDTRTESVYAPYLQGLLIAHEGKLVLEEYFYGFHANRPHDTRSAGKSFTSALVGLATDADPSLQMTTPVYALFPEPSTSLDPRKSAITVEHLLTMTSGFDCDDNDYNTPGNEDRMQSQEEEPDWYRYTLNLPMARNPGTEGVYCSAGINLLGGVLSRATQTWLPEFFQDRFARPLNIKHYHINLQPGGDAYLGGGLQMRPRDILKLGQLYLDQGMWQGQRILSQNWITRSTRPHTSINIPDDYGYAWWLQSYSVQQRTLKSYYASGNGGQLLIVIPELDVVVLFMGGNYGNFGAWRKFRDELVPEYILPALINH